jgi:hypothetical protein
MAGPRRFTRLMPIGVVVARRPHSQTIWERSKEFAVPAEPFKKLDVRWSGIRGGGLILIPLPNIGSGKMGAAPKAALLGKA